MFLLILIGLVTWFFAYHFYLKRRNFPPGPTPLPLLGNLGELMKYEPGYGAFQKWKEEFGPVYTVWLGTMPVVIFSDYETIKKTFIQKGELFMYKYQQVALSQLYRGGEYGVIDTNGETWTTHRRFTLRQLRDFGMGKNVLEEKIIREAEGLTEALLKQGPVIGNVQSFFDCAVGSIINQMLFGYRFDESHREELLKIKHLVAEQMRWFARPAFTMILTFPVIRYFPYFSGVFREVFKGRDQLYDIFSKQIAVHREKISKKSADEEVADYVEAYIREQEKREKEGDTESFCDLQLSNMCWDLWVAGLETTSNTLTWLIVYVLHHPEVQKKIHEELDRVIGDHRTVGLTDKNNLPYMNAVINETQRLANLLPLNTIHCVIEDYTIGSMLIQAGTGVVAQISNVLYDEKIFPEPHKFLPERFIDDSGNLKKVEELIPFSIGKRQCLGEGLARMELFLFAANVFNRFKIEPEGKLPTMKKVFGATMEPLESNCKVVYRF